MRQRGTRWLAAVAATIVVGIAVVAAVVGGPAAGEAPAATETAPAGDAAAASAAPVPSPPAEPAPETATAGGGTTSPAADPRIAVEEFLAAEQAGDLERSYRYLSARDREAMPTPEEWVASHADVLAPVTGFEIHDVARTAAGAVVETTVRFEPALDDVVGLTPASALTRWAAVEDRSGRWSVDLSGTEMAPRLPAETGAVGAARAWATALQHCERAGEWDGGLLGFPGLADSLCRRAGDVTVGQPEPLGDLDVEPFVAAFGDQAPTWLRTVAVRGPVHLRAVLAPLGERWVVVGVLDGG